MFSFLLVTLPAIWHLLPLSVCDTHVICIELNKRSAVSCSAQSINWIISSRSSVANENKKFVNRVTTTINLFSLANIRCSLCYWSLNAFVGSIIKIHWHKINDHHYDWIKFRAESGNSFKWIFDLNSHRHCQKKHSLQCLPAVREVH